jgi:hypothetical protein
MTWHVAAPLIAGMVAAVFALVVLRASPEDFARKYTPLSPSSFAAFAVGIMVVVWSVFPSTTWARIVGLAMVGLAYAVSYRHLRVWYVLKRVKPSGWSYEHAFTVIRFYAKLGWDVTVYATKAKPGEAQSLTVVVVPRMSARKVDLNRRVEIVRSFETGSVWYFLLLLPMLDPSGDAMLMRMRPRPATHQFEVRYSKAAKRFTVRPEKKGNAEPDTPWVPW